MVDCPTTELTPEQLQNILSGQTVFEYDKYTTVELIVKVKEFLIQIPGFEIDLLRPTTDMFIFYLGQTKGYIASFTKGCSDGLWFFDYDIAVELIKLMGTPS